MKKHEEFTGALFAEETTPETVPATAEKAYTAEEIQTATGFQPEQVKITAHTWNCPYSGTKSTVFRAAFVSGMSYRIPSNCLKSTSAEVVFTVLSNSGKSLKVDIFENYNGEIKTESSKRKPVCSGSHGIWCSYDPETNKFSGSQSKYPVEFIQIDTIDLAKVSRWTCGHVSCVECVPMTAAELETWKQNVGTKAVKTLTEHKESAELDFTPVFYPVSESLARAHKNMISWSDYKEGSETAEYQESVKYAYELAKKSDAPEKSLYLADCYAKRLARWYDDYNRNGASCPSVMISGAGNFPVRKKEKQNARFDTLMHQYDKIKHLLDKIKNPSRYEKVRETITAEEFENVLYFTVIINNSENRLQLIFDGKPEESERNILKHNGFRWSPRFKAWQRQLTENAVAAVWDVVNAFDALEDAENAEIQKETEQIKATVPESERTEEPEQAQEIQPEELPEESAQAETIPTECAVQPTDAPEDMQVVNNAPEPEQAEEQPTEPENKPVKKTGKKSKKQEVKKLTPEEMAAELEEMRNSDDWRESAVLMLMFTNKNPAIIMCEGITAGVITFEEFEDYMTSGRMPHYHTYQEWAKMGRQVKQGEHARFTARIWKYTEKHDKMTAEQAEALNSIMIKADGTKYQEGDETFSSKFIKKDAFFFGIEQTEKAGTVKRFEIGKQYETRAGIITVTDRTETELTFTAAVNGKTYTKTIQTGKKSEFVKINKAGATVQASAEVQQMQDVPETRPEEPEETSKAEQPEIKQETAEPETVKFIPNMVFWNKYQILKRTDKTLTIKNILTGETFRKKIQIRKSDKRDPETEYVKIGQYETIRATYSCCSLAESVEFGIKAVTETIEREKKYEYSFKWDGFAKERYDNAVRDLNAYKKIAEELKEQAA